MMPAAVARPRAPVSQPPANRIRPPNRAGYRHGSAVESGARAGTGPPPGASPSQVVPIVQTSFDELNGEISPDGQRFLMIKENSAGDPNATPASLIVVLNWFEELKAKLPHAK